MKLGKRLLFFLLLLTTAGFVLWLAEISIAFKEEIRAAWIQGGCSIIAALWAFYGGLLLYWSAIEQTNVEREIARQTSRRYMVFLRNMFSGASVELEAFIAQRQDLNSVTIADCVTDYEEILSKHNFLVRAINMVHEKNWRDQVLLPANIFNPLALFAIEGSGFVYRIELLKDRYSTLITTTATRSPAINFLDISNAADADFEAHLCRVLPGLKSTAARVNTALITCIDLIDSYLK